VTDQPDLFTQMDQAADLMRRENPYGGKADMALSFRDIQKSVMPKLTTEQYQDAFDRLALARSGAVGKAHRQGMGQHRRNRESRPAKRAIPLCVCVGGPCCTTPATPL
jgi:hypothetical protein